MAAPPPESRLRRFVRRRAVRIGAVIVVVVGLFSGANYGFWRYHLKRFQVVAPGVLYRSAQPTEFALDYLAKYQSLKTVVSLQLFDFRLYAGLCDFGEPDGEREAEYVRRIGLADVQWPMGEEQCWPWPTPWQFEEFFRLIDEPANHPILIHCMGGRHRTGTLAALYRLEYDRWKPEAALEEMYSFNFGRPVTVHEYNLRTYVPRPLPDEVELQSLREAFADALRLPATTTYAELVRALRHAEPTDAARSILAKYLDGDRPFALPLAARLIERSDDPLAAVAADAAIRRLHDRQASGADLTSAASITADFGDPLDQRGLLDLLEQEKKSPEPTAFYEALVDGIACRYTSNRIAFLKPLLDDERVRPGHAAVRLRYCDTAVVRLAAITDDLPVQRWDSDQVRVHGRRESTAWFDAHPERLKLSRLVPPAGNKTVLAGEGPREEDLSKMRR